jgi:hypothetical protein
VPDELAGECKAGGSLDLVGEDGKRRGLEEGAKKPVDAMGRKAGEEGCSRMAKEKGQMRF